MTSQPAIQLRSHFPVAADAEPHFEFNRQETVRAFYVSVTFGAVEPRPLDVGNVVEKRQNREPNRCAPRVRVSWIHSVPFLG